ncbi:copper resistance protein CopC [Leucobacter allii]|uniref:Copper resistance protein CopC n=1 Tax=Leucobacter allii TaxID=2932247 RepID=A0ABY4FPQ2_9MICO|nr:copper resistance CopC family protein [Leucobacter allii]UOQ58261.1 copper resistance protein CopC [Leucobacter allii]UOR02843.1 copper resistance protein CopC [Leucobacter allii]
MSRTTMSPVRPAAVRRSSSRALRLAAAGLLAGAASLGVAAPAFAHDQLVDTTALTAEDGALTGVQLTFSNSIIEVGTEIAVTDASGADVTDGAPEVSGPDVVQPVLAELPDGSYDVAWRVVSSDGHPIDGAFAVEIAGGSPELQEADADDHEHAEEAAGAEHEHADDEHADDAAAGADAEHAGTASGTSTGLAIAIGAGGVIVVAAAVAAIMVGQRRRAAGMGGDADGGSRADGRSSSDDEGRA